MELTDPVMHAFEDGFGTSPSVIARAPGRVEILGNHTDYNEGYVLSAAIDRYVVVAVGRSDDASVCKGISTQFDQIVTVNDPVPQSEHKWINYPLGVWAMLKEAGYPVAPFHIAVHGTIPMGAGLSSSAALEAATGMALCELFGISIDRAELAKICQKAEHEFCGTKCGLLDQYSVLFGKDDHVLFTDFRNLTYKTIPLPRHDLVLAITPSGVTHSLSDSAYNDRRSQCFSVAEYFAEKNSSVRALRDVSSKMLESNKDHLDSEAYRRAKHVVTEDERVLTGISLLESGDILQFGRLLFDSHESSRLNFENSCPELDTLVELAKAQGVFGSRLTGGGFGGATVSLLDESQVGHFSEQIPQEYQKETGLSTSVHRARIAQGASVLPPAE